MGLNNKKWDRLFDAVYEHPGKRWTVRDLARESKLPRSTVQVYVTQLKREGILKSDNTSADELPLFRLRKTWHFIERLFSSGVYEHLVNELNPSCIILFGAVRKGESTKESDIDLFVQSYEKKELNLSKYEKLLKHPLHLFVESDIKKLPVHLQNNVINGIKLQGSFKV